MISTIQNVNLKSTSASNSNRPLSDISFKSKAPFEYGTISKGLYESYASTGTGLKKLAGVVKEHLRKHPADMDPLPDIALGYIIYEMFIK